MFSYIWILFSPNIFKKPLYSFKFGSWGVGLTYNFVCNPTARGKYTGSIVKSDQWIAALYFACRKYYLNLVFHKDTESKTKRLVRKTICVLYLLHVTRGATNITRAQPWYDNEDIVLLKLTSLPVPVCYWIRSGSLKKKAC